MKRFLLMVIALFAINTMVQAQSHKVGDIVVIGNEVGVVFFVTPDGQHGKVMSTSENQSAAANAIIWCGQLGAGWRLPSLRDLQTIRNEMAHLNSVLSANGYETICDGYYWSAQYIDGIQNAVNLRDGKINRNYTLGTCYVRAVSAF